MASAPSTPVSFAAANQAASVRRSSPIQGLRITVNGLLALAVSILVAIASFTSEANLLLLLFAIAIGLMTVNLVVCVRTLRQIDAERSIGLAAVAGRPLRITYTVRSRRRWMRSWGIHISEMPDKGHRFSFSPGFIAVLDPGAEQRLELTTVCPHRGRLGLRGIRIACGFPFGLFTCRVDIDAPADIIVYPAVGRVRREFWHQQAMAEAPGSRRAHQGGGQDEFHGVREYRHGDNPRWIHWRRSAHTGELVVREHQTVRESEVIVLLDPWPGVPTSIPAHRGVLNRFKNGVGTPDRHLNVERIISAAATAVCEALDRGHRVGLIARGARPIVVPPTAGRAHRQRLLTELALLDPGGATSLEQLIRPIRWAAGRNVRCLLVAARNEEVHSRVLRALASRSESVLLVSPQSGWLDKLFDIPAAIGPERRGAL